MGLSAKDSPTFFFPDVMGFFHFPVVTERMKIIDGELMGKHCAVVIYVVFLMLCGGCILKFLNVIYSIIY